MILAALIVYIVGWCIMSIFGLFSWIMALGFGQDNMDTYLETMFKATLLVFILIWFWPIAVPIGLLVQNRENKRIEKANKLYRERYVVNAFRVDDESQD